MTLLALVAAVTVAAAVQTVSGFGFALVAAPALVALTDPLTAVSTLGVLGVIVSIVTLAAGRRRPKIDRRESAGLVAWALPALPLGAWLVTAVPEDAMRAAVGMLVLVALALRAAAPDVQSGRRVWSRSAAGLVSGAMTTSTALNGPPLVLHLTGARLEPRAVRDTLAALFVVLGIAGLAALALLSELRLPDDAAALLPAVVAGGLVGHRVHDRMSDRARSRAITAVLVASALTAIGSALL
jgi:uncharacterized membrane protein YfcA